MSKMFRPMAASRPALVLCSTDGLGHCSSRRRRMSECGSSNWCCLRRATRCRTSSDSVIAGGLMSYGPDQMDSYREAAVYTGRVLKGERPAELPVLVATKYDFMINLKTAKALDITIPPSMLALATSVIE